MKIQMFSIISE
ncbi:hypothetical protein CRE_15815 [Caenorhabditis remanei]|uniref:Uncharacterized protein n=1 Tax=Caenorhabditis remanei TaxID=31234 RepID=E3NPL7_CAERE|nr:hypothetical protein CRE_15815 [Caenorhabditis remanei]